VKGETYRFEAICAVREEFGAFPGSNFHLNACAVACAGNAGTRWSFRSVGRGHPGWREPLAASQLSRPPICEKMLV
jgi:hypothetical protein